MSLLARHTGVALLSHGCYHAYRATLEKSISGATNAGWCGAPISSPACIIQAKLGED